MKPECMNYGSNATNNKGVLKGSQSAKRYLETIEGLAGDGDDDTDYQNSKVELYLCES